jgi:hypothetical protein
MTASRMAVASPIFLGFAFDSLRRSIERAPPHVPPLAKIA